MKGILSSSIMSLNQMSRVANSWTNTNAQAFIGLHKIWIIQNWRQFLWYHGFNTLIVTQAGDGKIPALCHRVCWNDECKQLNKHWIPTNLENCKAIQIPPQFQLIKSCQDGRVGAPKLTLHRFTLHSREAGGQTS